MGSMNCKQLNIWFISFIVQYNFLLFSNVFCISCYIVFCMVVRCSKVILVPAMKAKGGSGGTHS